MALVSMFLCNQSYASHGRDFLLGATILNFNAGGAVCAKASRKQVRPGSAPESSDRVEEPEESQSKPNSQTKNRKFLTSRLFLFGKISKLIRWNHKWRISLGGIDSEY